MNEREKLEKKLSELAEEKLEVTKKLGAMAHTPKYEPSYSSAKLENWKKDVERLEESETKVHGQLEELIHSDAYQKKVAEKTEELVTKRTALKGEEEKVKNALTQKRYGAVQSILEGAEPVKYVSGLVELEEKYEVLSRAIQYVQDAITKVQK
jgi:DNA repair exonuclease SbcCD ATPase subunit